MDTITQIDATTNEENGPALPASVVAPVVAETAKTERSPTVRLFSILSHSWSGLLVRFLESGAEVEYNYTSNPELFGSAMFEGAKLVLRDLGEVSVPKGASEADKKALRLKGEEKVREGLAKTHRPSAFYLPNDEALLSIFDEAYPKTKEGRAAKLSVMPYRQKWEILNRPECLRAWSKWLDKTYGKVTTKVEEKEKEADPFA
jgi:hypothetical protein